MRWKSGQDGDLDPRFFARLIRARNGRARKPLGTGRAAWWLGAGVGWERRRVDDPSLTFARLNLGTRLFWLPRPMGGRGQALRLPGGSVRGGPGAIGSGRRRAALAGALATFQVQALPRSVGKVSSLRG